VYIEQPGQIKEDNIYHIASRPPTGNDVPLVLNVIQFAPPVTKYSGRGQCFMVALSKMKA
jgi:hypothetical protein